VEICREEEPVLNKLKTGLFVALCLLAGASYADLNEAQQSVWEVVEQSWVDDVAKNGKWPANYVHDEVVNWGEEWPTPQRKASMMKWSRFADESDARILIYELFPVAIVVVGDTAVVNYNIVTIEEDAKKERKRESRGLVETLVRDGKTWKYLGLTDFIRDSDD